MTEKPFEDTFSTIEWTARVWRIDFGWYEGSYRAEIERFLGMPDGGGVSGVQWAGQPRSDPLAAEFDLAAVARMFHQHWGGAFHQIEWPAPIRHDACALTGCLGVGWPTEQLVEWVMMDEVSIGKAMSSQ